MAITLRSGKELQSRDEAKKKRTEAETEKAYQNSTGSENKKNKNGLSNEAQQLKEQGEMTKEKTLQKEEMRAYQLTQVPKTC